MTIEVLQIACLDDNYGFLIHDNAIDATAGIDTLGITPINAALAITVETDNLALQTRIKEIAKLRSQGNPTVPTSIKLKTAINPFVRASSQDLQNTIGLSGADLVDVFAETRKCKDHL